MDHPDTSHQPASLQEGGTYYLKIPARYGETGSPIPVTLAAYTACPAVIVVQNEEGSKFRCRREWLVVCI